MYNICKRSLSLVLTILIFISVSLPSFSAADNEFEYEIINGSTSVRITGYKGSAEDVTVPDVIDGRTVVEISAFAFSGNNTIKNLQISNNVTKILKEAFRNCSVLESVVIPASVTSIGDSAFANCVSLKNIVISSASTSIGYYCFEGCTALKEITVPSSKIGYAAFRNCTALETINLLDTVQSVGRYAFDGTAWLKNQSSGVVVLDKVVYLYTGESEDVIIPDGIICIADYAFADTNVKSVVIPDGLYYIGLYAFYCCPELKYLSVPDSVVSIGTNAIGYSENGRIENFVIYCKDNSVAKSWADGNSFPSESIDNCSHTYSEWVVTTAPTCIEQGEREKRCIKCNSVERENVSELGHSWSGWVTFSELTCLTNEVKQKTCTVCSETEDSVVLSDGHKWSEWTVSVEPDCVNNGEQVHTCSVCDESESEEIPALGHVWVIDDNTDDEGWKVTIESSCSKAGEKSRLCNVCNETEVTEIPSLPHVADEWTVIKDPTTITVGIKEGTCNVCGEVFRADIEVITEEMPDDVNALKLRSGSTLRFNASETYLLGINGETTVNDVLLQFEYPSYIFATDSDLNQLNGDDLVRTGGFLILVRFNDETQQYDPIDTVFVVTKGDINGDGQVTAVDARLVLRRSANLETFTDLLDMAADADDNGVVTASDARKVLRVSAEIDYFD